MLHAQLWRFILIPLVVSGDKFICLPVIEHIRSFSNGLHCLSLHTLLHGRMCKASRHLEVMVLSTCGFEPWLGARSGSMNLPTKLSLFDAFGFSSIEHLSEPVQYLDPLLYFWVDCSRCMGGAYYSY